MPGGDLPTGSSPGRNKGANSSSALPARILLRANKTAGRLKLVKPLNVRSLCHTEEGKQHADAPKSHTASEEGRTLEHDISHSDTHTAFPSGQKTIARPTGSDVHN